MDNIILPDIVQNQQICTECQNYLSVGPIMVSGGGKIICGRCSNGIHAHMKVLECSLYNLVAEKLVFKCINYYAGCLELLLFNEAVEHEKTCKKRMLKCPFCDYDGNGCQLVHHFNKKHRKYVIKEGFFNVNIENQFSRNIIVIKDSNILCLTLFVNDTFLSISNLLVTPADLGPKHFKLRFFQSQSNVEFVTPSIQVTRDLGNILSSNLSTKNTEGHLTADQINQSFLLDQTSLLECFPSGSCLCKVELMEANVKEEILKLNYFKKFENVSPKLPLANVSQATVDRKTFNINCVLKMSPSALRQFINSELYLLQNCVNCKKYVTDVFLCPKYHMSCKICSGTRCSVCKSFPHWTNRSDIHNISLACDWDGCFKRTNIFNYTIHKQTCKFRRYECPDARCKFTGCLGCLKVHWHMNPLISQETLSFSYENCAIFWLLPQCNEIFYITIEYNPVSKEYVLGVHEVNAVVSKRYNVSVQEWRKIKFCGVEMGMRPDRQLWNRFSKETRGSVRFFKVKAHDIYSSQPQTLSISHLDQRNVHTLHDGVATITAY